MDSISPGCGEAQPLALFGPIAHRSTVELHALLQEAVDIVLSVSFGVGRNIWAPQASRGSAAGRSTAPPLRTPGRPKEPESTVICAASARPFEACLRTALPCTRVHPRISFTRLDQVRELPELRGSPGGMTSATGCTEFTLGTVMRSIFAPVLISGPQHYPPRVSSTDTLRVPLPSPLSRDKSGAAVPWGFVSLDLYSSFAR